MNKEQRELLETALGSLPEKEGYELVGVESKVPLVGEIFRSTAEDLGWTICRITLNVHRPTAIFKKLEPAPKPTTIHDLMPEGDENVYLHKKEESWASFITCNDGELYIGGWGIPRLIELGSRWSHSIHTPYSEANEFVV